MDILDKVAYLRGFADGLGISEKSDEGKLISKLIDVLDELAFEVSLISEEQEDLSEITYSINESLSDLEDDFYGEELEDDMWDDEFLVCPECDSDIYVSSEDLYNSDEDIRCPECDTVIISSEEIDNDEIKF